MMGKNCIWKVDRSAGQECVFQAPGGGTAVGTKGFAAPDVVSVMRFVKLRFAPSSRSFLGHRESHQNSWFLIHVTSL